MAVSEFADVKAQLVPLETLHELPLSSLWDRCYAIYSRHEALASAASRSEEAAALLRDCGALLAGTERRIAAQGVFSSNETEEDLTTGDMKYLLVPFYLGEVALTFPARGPHQRAGAVQEAISAFGRFLSRAEQYGLLGQLGTNMHDAYERSGGAVDSNTKRTLKLGKFKREKALATQIQELQKRQQGGDKEQDAVEASTTSSSVNGASGGGGALDEEGQRHLWSLSVELAALKALEARASLNQEMELLQHALRAAEARDRGGGGGGEDEELPGTSSSSSSKLGGSGRQGQGQGQQQPVTDAEKSAMIDALRNVLADLGGAKRDQIKQQVFRPSHALPTMSLEEQARIECDDAMRREEAQRKAQAAEQARRAALDSDEEDEEDKRKARAWDDYRDANPRGAGNSKIRPCG